MRFIRLGMALVMCATVACNGEGIRSLAPPGGTGPESPNVAAVLVSPATVKVPVGGVTQLTAVPRDGSGNALPNTSVKWTSSDPTVASVSDGGSVKAQKSGISRITASAGTAAGTADVVVAEVPVASVGVVPATISLSVGGQHQLVATAFDESGQPLSGRAFAWSSSNVSIVSVSSSGQVTAHAAGSVSITASSEGKSAQSAVTVSDAAPTPVATVAVSLTSSALSVGQGTQATATLRDASGNILGGRIVTWATSDASVATINASGYVNAVAVGSVTVSATSEGKTGSASLTISAPATAPVASVAVSPASGTLEVGQTLQLSATTRDANGNLLSGRSISWTSSAPAVASVSSSGLVTALTAGSATISAASEGKTGSSALQVNAAAPKAASVLVNPESATIDALGHTAQLTATAKDASGSVLSGASFVWTSVNTGVATVSTTGMVTAKAVGTALIIATAGLVSDTATVTVRQVPASVTLNSSSVALTVGQTAQLQATLRDAGGAAIPGTSATWTSSAPAVASVSSSGLVTALTAGSATVAASASGFSADAAITVTVPPPPPPSGSLLVSSSELAALPMSGAAWEDTKAVADGSLGTPDLTNQDNKHSVMTLAVALVAARTGSAVYREKARAAIMSAIGTERVGAGNSILALGRILGAYVLAADLIGLDGADDVAFRAWLDPLRTRNLGGHSRWYTLKGTCEDSSNNWGAYACASLLAANLYLGDAAGVTRSWAVYSGFTGDRASFIFPEVTSSRVTSWRCTGAPWTPINVASNCGDKLGAPPEDAHRAGDYPTLHKTYTQETMSGLAFQAELLQRAGYPAWERLRLTADFATRWGVWNASAVGTHLPWWYNKRLGISAPTQSAGAGRLFGYTDWLYAN